MKERERKQHGSRWFTGWEKGKRGEEKEERKRGERKKDAEKRNGKIRLLRLHQLHEHSGASFCRMH